MTTEVNRIDRTADEGAGGVEEGADIRMTGEGATAVVGRIVGAEIEIGTGIEIGTETEIEIGDLSMPGIDDTRPPDLLVL